MKKMENVLRSYAIEVLNQIKDYDIEECVLLQSGDITRQNYYKAMRESWGWDTFRRKCELTGISQARFKMIELLNREIEILMESRMNNKVPPKGLPIKEAILEYRKL